jgi:hypothetical protein
VLSLHEISALLLVQGSPGLTLRSIADIEFLVATGFMEPIPLSDAYSGVKLTEKGHDVLRRLGPLATVGANGNAYCPGQSGAIGRSHEPRHQKPENS